MFQLQKTSMVRSIFWRMAVLKCVEAAIRALKIDFGSVNMDMLITDDGTIIRTRAADVRLCGRATQGVRIMRLAEGSSVVGVCRAEKEEEPEETDNPEEAGTADTAGTAGDEQPSENKE